MDIPKFYVVHTRCKDKSLNLNCSENLGLRAFKYKYQDGNPYPENIKVRPEFKKKLLKNVDVWMRYNKEDSLLDKEAKQKEE